VLQVQSRDSRFRRSWLPASLVGLVFAVGGDAALAANYTIPSQTSKFECKSVRPGDTITLPAGTRGPLRILGCSGTPSNPIVIRNDPNGNAPAEIRSTSGNAAGFVLQCQDCVGVAIDGSAKWNGAPSGRTYGIKLTITGGKSPSAFLKMAGKSRFFTIRNVEIDGGWPGKSNNGSGINVNDQVVKRNANPGLWREGILIEDNYIHDVAKEGMYVGPNYSTGGLPLRDVVIRNNLVEDTGWDGINTKSMWSGDNRVHHNIVRRAGMNQSFKSKPSQYSGIMNMSGTVKIYNNWVEATGQHGIHVWAQGGPKQSERKGPFEAHIWNNVVVDAGVFWKSFMNSSYGINVGAESGVEKPLPFVYNNTITNSRQRGINIGNSAGGGFVRDNIVAGTGGNPVISAPSHVELLNNRVGSIAQLEFVDPTRKNFRLKISSPARNEATNGFPPTDHADVPRPKEGAADQGAFEGSGS